MGMLSGLFGKRGRLAWASFLSESEYQTFTALTQKALAAHSATPDFDGGTAKVRIDGKVRSVGLSDLARKCHVSNPQGWSGLIAEHFDRLVNQRGKSLVAELGTSFDKAKGYLKAQLVPDDFVRPDWVEGENFKSLKGGVNVALVYDLPESVTSVPMAHVRTWKLPLSELLEAAVANVKKGEPALVPKRLDLKSTFVFTLEGKSFFVCSHALWLQEYAEARSPNGVLFTVPSRHVIQFHPMKDSKASEALKVLALTARKLSSQLPGPISTHVFWSRGDEIVPIPFAIDAQGVPFPCVVSEKGEGIEPVTQLLALLQQLPRG
ncbi:MAG TPA: hypothetical protein VMB50_19500 [Myxococcales bacterium]|nr:hypothetical protein [Myxococcales bacterium]